MDKDYLQDLFIEEVKGSLTSGGGGSPGYNTTASGEGSHAEGYETTASGKYSHAEGGNTTASGGFSHAEGGATKSIGGYSHAEGQFSTASGSGSHAEGSNTKAIGVCSHAEGSDTIASGEYQHAQGRYNIVDSNNHYAHIVGNGDADNKRSNAHTLDWEGNAWFAGDVESKSLTLTAPNGTKRSISVADDGSLVGINEGSESQVGGYVEENTIMVLDAKNQDAEFGTTDPTGLNVNDYLPGRRKLVVSAERPTNLPDNYAAGAWRSNTNSQLAIQMEYGTYNGYLNKPCFLITGTALPFFCLFFYKAESINYDSLIYAYETTKDNLGLGITFEKGWYALSSTTFAFEPFDISLYPVCPYTPTMTLYSNTDEGKAFFNACFPEAERITYTITKDHIFKIGDGGGYAVANTPCAISNLKDTNQFDLFSMYIMVSFISDDAGYVSRLLGDGNVVVYEEIIHPIDPRCLPEGGFGYSTFGEPTPLIPSRQYTFEEGTISVYVDDNDIELSLSDLVIVNLDGVEYRCSNLQQMSGTIIFGNMAAVGGDDTGEPFISMVDVASRCVTLIVISDMGGSTTTHNISIDKVAETIHLINPKYLGSAKETLLDVSDFNLVSNNDVYNLSEEFQSTFKKGVLNRNLVLTFIEKVVSTGEYAESWLTCNNYTIASKNNGTVPMSANARLGMTDVTMTLIDDTLHIIVVS